VTLYDGSYHPVDSSEMSFKIAASMGFKKAAADARPVLLEPVVELSITVPDAYTGDIIGDLNTKRAQVLGMVPEDGFTTIQARAPYSEMRRYATDLRSIYRSPRPVHHEAGWLRRGACSRGPTGDR